MDSCLKCKKDISESVAVAGTTYHAVTPSFLRVPTKDVVEPEVDPVEESDISFEGGDAFDEEDYDFSDPELDILVDEDDTAGDAEQVFTLSDSDSDDFLLEDDDEESDEGSFEFELEDDEESDGDGSFEFELEEDEIESSPAQLTESPSLNIPEELADISDLAPPEEESPAALSTSALNLSLDDEMSLDDDLDLDGLDLGLTSTKDILDEDITLSLDDIDLSAGDIIDGSNDLDDLSMDLDLGALDGDPAPAAAPATKEKSSGSLDGISLSLD
jgi:hypothetical protein